MTVPAWSGAEHSATRAGKEAGLDEERHRLGLDDRPAVEPLDCKALRVTFAHPVRERDERGPEPCLVGLTQRDEGATTPLDVERGRATEEDDVSAGDPGRARTRPPRPR